MPGRRIRVLYLGGIGRSGSTLIERLLGEIPGVCAVGELVHLWGRGITEGERCGCGEPFRLCPFWRQIGVAAFGGWDEVDVGHVAALRARVDRNRFIPLLARRRDVPPGLRQTLTEYTAYYARLYTAIAEVSGCQLIVDSSKHPSLAHCLRWQQDIDLRVLHVIRDSRAVAFSWSKHVRRPEADSESYMTRYSAAMAAGQWNAQNAVMHLLARLGCPTMRMKYEDFATSPEEALHRIVGFAGLPEPDGYPFMGTTGESRWAQLNKIHTVSGNPMRFTTGKVQIRQDDRWRSDMSKAQRYTVTAITLPMLAGYGYVGSGHD